MSSKFDAYDVLGIVVPGTMLLSWVALCFPEMATNVPKTSFPAGFSVIALTALAVFIGQLVQAVASICEPLVYKSWGGRPSDKALDAGIPRFLPGETAKRIRAKLEAEIGDSSSGNSLFLFAMQLSDGLDTGRARRFNTLYAYHRALLQLMAIGGLVFCASVIWGHASTWSWGEICAAVLVWALLSSLIWYRAWQRACYYVREVLLTAERVLDDRSKERE